MTFGAGSTSDDLRIASGAEVTLQGSLSSGNIYGVDENGTHEYNDGSDGITVNVVTGAGETFKSYAWYASNGSVYTVAEGSTVELTYANINATGTVNVSEGATLTTVMESSNIVGTLNVDGTMNGVMTVYAGYTGGQFTNGAQAGEVNINGTGTVNTSIMTIGTAVRDDDKYNAAAFAGSSTTASVIVDGGTLNATGFEGELTSKLLVGSDDFAGILTGKNGAKINVGERSANGTGYMRFVIGTQGTLSLADSTLTVYNLGGTNNSDKGIFENNGTISMDLDSLITTATVLNNLGTITVDMTGADEDSGVYKLVDYTGTGEVTGYGNVTLSNSAYETFVIDGDLYAANVDTTTLKVNAAWSGLEIGDKVADGYYYGFNAFDTFQDAYNSGTSAVTILIGSDLTGVTGELGIDAPYRSDIRISSDDGNEYTLTFASPSNDGLYAWNPGQKITIDKEITLTNMAQLMAVDADTLVTIDGNVTSMQLWAGFGGTVNINETASVTLTYGDGWLTLRNGGTVNVIGTVEDALSLDISTVQAQFKHGYSSIGDARSSNNYANSTNVFNLTNTFVDGGSWMNIGAATWNSGRNSVNMTNSVFKVNALNMYDDGKFNVDAGSRVIVNGALRVAEESAMTLSNNSSLTAKSVTVEAGATIKQDATSTIAVSGNFVNNGNATFDGTTTIDGNYTSDALILNPGAVFSAGSITVDALTMALGSSLTLTGTGTAVNTFTVTGDTLVDMTYQLVVSGWNISYAAGQVVYQGETYTVQTDATSLTGINFVLGADGSLYVKDFGATPEQVYIGTFDETWSGEVGSRTKVIDGVTYLEGYTAFESMDAAMERYPEIGKTVTSVILVNETVADDFLLDPTNVVDTITVSALSGADEQNRTVSTIADGKVITIGGDLKLTVDLGAELSGGTIDVGGYTTVVNNGHLDTTLVSDGSLSITNTSDYTLSGEYTAPSIDLDNSGTAVDLTLTATTGNITIDNSGTMTGLELNANNAVVLAGNGVYSDVTVNAQMLYLSGIDFTFSEGEVGTVYLSDQLTSTPGGTLTLTGGAVGMVDGFNFGSTMSSGTVIFDGADLSKTSLRDIQRLTLASGTSSFDESGMATYYMNELEIADGATLVWNWTSDDWLIYNIGAPTADDSLVAVVDADGTFAFTQSGEYALENFNVSAFAGQVTVAGGSTLNLGVAESYFADGASVTLQNTDAKLNLNGYGAAEVTTGMNFAGNGEVVVNADHSLTGDLSKFTGVYTLAADQTATFEEAAKLAETMTLNGEGTAEFATRTTPAAVQITSDALATNLVLNNNDATLVGGSYGAITTAADDGSISIIAGININAEAVDVNAVNISIDSTLDYTGPALTVSGLANDFGSITVTSDTAEFKSPYTLIATDDGVGFGSELTFTVGADSVELTIGGTAVRFNNFWIQAYVEDGDLKIANVPGDSGDILVNSDWPTTAGAQVDWLGVEHIIDRDASKTVDRAFEIVAPKSTGEASTITIVKADTYRVSNVAMTAENGVSKLVVSADSLDAANPLQPGDVFLSGDLFATDGTAAGTELTLRNVSVIGNIFGGAADAKLAGNAALIVDSSFGNTFTGMVFGGSKITSGTVDDTGISTSLTIDGGAYAGAYVAGGYYAQGGVVNLDSSELTVTNTAADKLLINGRLTGGGVAQGAGASITQESASITIDSSDADADVLYLRGDIYAGGIQLGGSSVSVDETSVTFTGLGEKLSFTSRVSGGVYGQTVGEFAGESTLVFDDFTGEFQGLIQDFGTMKFTGDSVVTFSRKQTLSSEMNLEFSIEGRTNTTEAMFTVNQYGWVYGDTITITTGDFTTGSYVLADGYDFSSLNFVIDGAAYTLGAAYTDAAGNTYTVTAADSKLVLDYTANPNKITIDDATGEQDIAGYTSVEITGMARDITFLNTESLELLTVDESALLSLASQLDFTKAGTVNNNGTIVGAENEAVLYAAGAPLTVVNTGEISATPGDYNYALHTYGKEGRFDLVNSGTIHGALYANTNSTSDDTSVDIENTGIISVVATRLTSNAVEVNGPLTLTGDVGLIEIIGYGSAIDGYDGINVAGNGMTIQSLVTDETAQDGKNHEFYAITQNRDNAIEISGDGNQIIAKGTSTSGTYGIYETSTRTSAKVIVSGDNNAITADATTQGSYGRSGTAVGIGTRYASVEVTGNGTQITADYVRLDGNASNVCGIYTDHDSASITISGNDTKISVSSQATNAPTTGIQANKASAITVTGNGTEITIDVNDANVAKAMGIVTGSVNGSYGGSITVGSFADDGSVTTWNDLKISITGNAAVEKGLYTAKGSISIALDAEGSISAATAIEANNLQVFSKGTIDGNILSTGSNADKVALLDGGSITGNVNLGAGEDLFSMDVDSLLDGTLSNAEIVDITGFDNLAGTSGSVGLIAGIGSMTDGFQLDGFEAELGVAQQVSDTLWAKLSNDDGSLVVSWGDSVESVSATFEAFNNNTTLDFGSAMVSTDGTSFSDLSREEFSEKKNNGTLA